MRKIVYIMILLGMMGGIGFILKGNKEVIELKSKPDAQKAIPVVVSSVQKDQINEKLVMTGVTAPFHDVMILSETQGRILKMNVDVGSNIGKDAIICEVDDELKVVQVTTAQANVDKAKKDVERFEALIKENAGTEIQLEGVKLQLKLAESQLTVAKRQLKDSKIRSPFAGQISAKMADIGMTLGPGTPIVNLVDVSQIKVKVNVAENDAFKLKIGQMVTITADAFENQVITGKIISVNVKGDEAHTYPVEILIANPGGQFKAGMFCSVDFKLNANRQSLLIPRKALEGSVKEPSVFVVENGKAIRRKIKLGAESGTKVEVLSGLVENDNIVISGQNNLNDGSPVSIIK